MYLAEKSLSIPEKESLLLKMVNTDPSNVCMTGESIDRIIKKGVVVEERVGHNLVVNSFLNLVMCLLSNQSGYTGLQYWAVGSGADSWDSAETLPAPEAGATSLTAELGRVPLTSADFKFLTSSFEESSVPTNILQVSHVFSETDCNGVWREFGLFGGNATTAANSGILINKRHHKVLTKTEDIQVERVMRFTLNLA